MPETLSTSSSVLLFGREMQDVGFLDRRQGSARSSKAGSTKEVLQGSGDGDRRLARIYAFAYEGHYYDLASPAIFVVHGPGTKPPNSVDQLGVAATKLQFADDILVWQADKMDFSVRLDVQRGTLEQILLEAELRSDRLQVHYSGEKARLRGDRGPGSGGL